MVRVKAARPILHRYRCSSCQNALSAPATWAGRLARCPACGVEQAVATQDDATAVRPVPRDALPASQLEGEGAATEATLREVVPPSSQPAPRRRFRRAWVWAILVVGLVATAYAGWRVWRTRFAPDAIARRHVAAQHGRSAYPRVGELERRVAENPNDPRATRRLAAAYERVIEQAGRRGSKRIPMIYNNAAWLYLTTPIEAVRDVERGLRYAEIAVAATGGEQGVVLDTLAEALHLNGRHEDAVRVAEQAVALEPDEAELGAHLEIYRAAAKAAADGSASPPSPPR